MRYCCVLLLFVLTGCEGLHFGTPIKKITRAQVQALRVGMSVADVQSILGRPFEVVTNPLDSGFATHRYRMDGEEYVDFVETYDFESDERERLPVKKRQAVVIELLFAGGRLAKPR